MYKTKEPEGLVGNWFINLYGDPGVGKSSLCAYAPPPVHWIDTGQETMIFHYDKHLPRPAAIYDCHSNTDVAGVIHDVTIGKIRNVGTLVFDNATDFLHAQLDDTATKLKTGRDRGGVLVPTQEDYLISTALLRSWWLKFEKNFVCNVVVICHRLEDVNPKTNRVTIRPDLNPKAANQFSGKVSAQLFMTLQVNQLQKEEIRTIRSRPTNIIQAKNRLGLPEEFPAEELWKLIGEARADHS